MARVTTPLLCLSASGQFAKTMVATTWKGLKVMRQYVTPANPRTVAQVAQRSLFTNAVAAWRNFFTDAIERAAWNLTASSSGKAQSGFNAFMSAVINITTTDPAASFADGGTNQTGSVYEWNMKNVDDGATGDEAGSFEIWVGSTSTNLLNFGSGTISSGTITTGILGLAGTIVFIKLRKDGEDRSGKTKITLLT